MDFTLEEIRCILEEMGLKNIPDNQLKHFAKDLKHLMKHEKHVQKRKRTGAETAVPAVPAPQPSTNLARLMLPEGRPSCTLPTTSQPMGRPTTSFYPSQQQVNFAFGAGKKLPADNSSNDLKNQAVKPVSATNSTSKTENEKAKLAEEARWKKLKTDPVRLYGWYKTHWEFHGLD